MTVRSVYETIKRGLRGTTRDRRNRERGQSLVELSLAMPIIAMLMLGVADFARLYATMITVESASREAADFGAFNSSNWVGLKGDPSSNFSKTVAAMKQRICVSSQHLTDFAGSTTNCSNPKISISLVDSDGNAATGCDNPTRTGGPCLVKVDLDYDFDLLVPFALEVGESRFGLPETVSFRRTSVFANSDFELDV